ncbi:MAG: hypothetical protein ACRYHQ_38540 [Janthinobacterium lividum]
MPTAIKQAGALNLHHAALLVMLAGGSGWIVPVSFVRAIWGRLQQGPDVWRPNSTENPRSQSKN